MYIILDKDFQKSGLLFKLMKTSSSSNSRKVSFPWNFPSKNQYLKLYKYKTMVKSKLYFNIYKYLYSTMLLFVMTKSKDALLRK